MLRRRIARPRRGRPLAALLARFALVAALAPSAAGAQALTRPWLDWRTARTRHFDVHYPARMSAWADDVIVRLDAVHEAVAAIVGSAPAQRVTVVIEDPSNVSNGFALPFLRVPTIFLFPTPPDPASPMSANRGWGEILSVHELAHVAHTHRPSRNPREGPLWRLSPVRLGPIARRSPRWVLEGYATYVEGKLTGTGRPRGAGRAAILRRWALEGRLPGYAQLNGARDFQQGGMAYLAGSAFLEWLVAQRGEQSLVDLWKRLSARQRRSFDEAFAGVYGGLPADLYGRFTVELTGRSLEIERQLEAAGLQPGEEVQRLTWYTGRPAVSRDGRLLAVPLAFRDEPGRIVIWPTEADTLTDRERRAQERARRRDPEDVPGVEWRPRARKPVATLRSFHGMSWASPRFFADGARLLVVRQVGRGDGTLRPELFSWDTRDGGVRQVTHDQGVRWGDPSPDGRRAIGTRCADGICDLVRIDLANGDVRVVHAGSPRVVFSTPRYAPDGRSVAVTVQRGDSVHVALTDDEGAPLRFLVPADGARRYEAEFAGDGRALYVVSEAGGIPNIERLPLDGGPPTPVTRVTGAALAPAFNGSKREIYFLSLETRGFNLRRVPLDSAARGPVVSASPTLAPVATLGVVPADTFRAASPVAPGAYGIGPRRYRLVPSFAAGADGWAPGLLISSVDPIGRFAWTLHGVYAHRAAWEGVALSAAWRGLRPTIDGDLFALRQRPGRGHDAMPGIALLDTRYHGGRLGLTLERPFGWRSHRYRLGASYGELRPEHEEGSPRRELAYAEHASAYQLLRGRRGALSTRVALHGSVGRTDGDRWRRAVGGVGLGARLGAMALRADGVAGFVNRDAPGFERMLVGGGEPTLADPLLLSQRLTMAALPLAARAGAQAAAVRVAIPGRLEPYWWAASAGTRFDGWSRVLGVEARDAIGTLAGPMLVGLPGLSANAGVAYPLDGPLRHRVRGYLEVTWHP